MDIKKDILWRVYVCFIAMVLLCICVLGRAIYIQRAEGSFWKKESATKHIKEETILAERGTIYSEDGNMLSTSVPTFDIYIDFGAQGLREKGGKRFIDNIDSLSYCLANLFADKDADAYKQQLQKAFAKKDRYYSLHKKISFEQYQQLRSYPLVRLGRNKSGFIVDVKDKRINPYVLLANRTIGLSRNNAAKNVGLERTYDSVLKGAVGQRLMRYVAGTYLPVEGSEIEPVNGKDIITTLDTYMQDVAENALMKMMVNNNSLHGTAMVMETATGKIKAIANLGKQPDESYMEDLNYGVGKTTEPGSVFKLATLISLIEDGYVDTATIVNCEGGKKLFHGLRIADSHPGTYETTVIQAFATSSNVAFAKLANEYYQNKPQQFLNHLHKFRLDTYTGVDITAASGFPLIKKVKAKSWSATTIPYMAHGYEALVTPLHMLTFYNAVANGGKLMRPYLVNSIMNYGQVVKTMQPEVLVQKICSDATIKKVQQCLLQVVEGEHGTARKVVKNELYAIAGKTGTAVTALDNKGYNKSAKVYQASFIGYFPAEAPKYTIAVVIQNTRASKLIYGADVAGAVFREISDKIYARFLSTKSYQTSLLYDSTINIAAGSKNDMQAIFNYMSIPFVDANEAGTWRNVSLGQFNATLSNNKVEPAQVMPNVVTMGLKDAVYLLESKGLKVSFEGKGKVINQDVPVGTLCKKGKNIKLYLQ